MLIITLMLMGENSVTRDSKYHTERVKGKIFKVLPLFQEGNKGLTSYIGSLIYELNGMSERLNERQESMLRSIIDVLEEVYNDSIAPNPDMETVRKEILNCVSLFQKLSEYGDKK